MHVGIPSGEPGTWLRIDKWQLLFFYAKKQTNDQQGILRITWSDSHILFFLHIRTLSTIICTHSNY